MIQGGTRLKMLGKTYRLLVWFQSEWKDFSAKVEDVLVKGITWVCGIKGVNNTDEKLAEVSAKK